MKTLSLASQILERHQHILNTHKVVFAGDNQDNYASQFSNATVLTSQFHHYQRLKNSGINAIFNAIFSNEDLQNATLLVFYWPKTKDEAIFQLTQLLSVIDPKTELLIVGENRIGVRSIENRFNDILTVQKIDTAKRCSLYYAKIMSQPSFDLDKYWMSYTLANHQTHHALPGVFSRQHLDAGSQLLIQSMNTPLNRAFPLGRNSNQNPLSFLSQPKMHAEVLDLCCGAGVLTLGLHDRFPNIRWTLADSQAQSLLSAKKNLTTLGIDAKIIASDMFSEIEGKYDMILTNPPFHDGKQTDYSLTENLIKQAPNFLRPHGALRLVANGFLPYESIMQNTFNNVEILEKTSQFTIYQSIK